MKYLTRGRAVSSHTSVKCDATALIHECRIAMFLYYFSYAFTKRKDEIVHAKKPSPNLDNKISSHGVVFFLAPA